MCIYWNSGGDGVAVGKKSSPLGVRKQSKQTGWWTPKNQSDSEVQGSMIKNPPASAGDIT